MQPLIALLAAHLPHGCALLALHARLWGLSVSGLILAGPERRPRKSTKI